MPKITRTISIHFALWSLWLCGRGIMLLMRPFWVDSDADIHYYFASLTDPASSGTAEYPPVGIWPAEVTLWLAGEDPERFLLTFIALILLCDAAFHGALIYGSRGLGTKDRVFASVFWSLFAPLLGAVYLYRLDLYPAAGVGIAALFLFSYPALTAVFIGWATMVKLWPGLLAVASVRGYRNTRTYIDIGVGAITLTVLTIAVLLRSGVWRLLTPLTYQGERGLQIESVVATPLLFRAAQPGSDEYELFYAASKSFEITGPAVSLALSIASALMLLTFLMALTFALVVFRYDLWNPQLALSFMVSATSMLLVANKVFSPQYITWLGPMVAVAVVFCHRKLVSAIALLTLALAGLSHCIYPFHYADLFSSDNPLAIGLVAIYLRNSLVVALMLISMAWTIVELRAAYAHRRVPTL
ncbi:MULTISPECIES: hypothetical protein [unclassified Corynebacterium]|uniref:hypothetical protein n=1 Tax=unclassified Corynebacterium TaxID=2624378 RepID=UPI002167C6E2|nr:MULTISPECIES: hypothetical protein [unclassified Corynebacterium]MCS4489221.1 hypothetical protein [Corynebacterium sp. ES2775-CONJ]MCS4491034.1 hypothetical protein [Corynebacterium sp. ES2715-CONJ3]